MFDFLPPWAGWENLLDLDVGEFSISTGISLGLGGESAERRRLL